MPHQAASFAWVRRAALICFALLVLAGIGPRPGYIRPTRRTQCWMRRWAIRSNREHGWLGLSSVLCSRRSSP